MLRQCSRCIAAAALSRQAACAALDTCAPGLSWVPLYANGGSEGCNERLRNTGHVNWVPCRGFASGANGHQPDNPETLLRRRVSEANMVLQVLAKFGR